MKRETQKECDYRWDCLPYGLWTTADGRLVLYNRKYEPIWQRWPDDRVETADRAEWVPQVKQEWFYWDGWRPSQERLEQILGAFCSGRLKVLKSALKEKETRRAAEKQRYERHCQRLGIEP